MSLVSDYIDISNNAASLDYAPALEPFTGVRLWYDDDVCYFAGDESGRVLEADCPWATQAIANSVLNSIRGFEYQPFEAGTALLNPEAELGDGVRVGGVYAPLASINTTFNAMYTSDISAPSDEEVDHEYPFLTKQERELSRKVALGKAYYGTRITRQNGLEVVKTDASGTETARVRLNSDELAFYDASGDEALYFDAAAGKYRFRGDVEITGGTMNVNNNFIVDEDGNLTINGSINLSSGVITWGSNSPVKVQFSPNGTSGWSTTQRSTDKYRRDWDYTKDTWGPAYKFVGTDGADGSDGRDGKDGKDGQDGSDGDPVGYLRSIGITEITSSGVKAPKIEGGEIWGAEIIGGALKAVDRDSELKITDSGIEYHKNGYRDWRLFDYDGGTWSALRLQTTEYGRGLYLESGGDILLEAEARIKIESLTDSVWFEGSVNFSKATVTGLDIPTTATAVWG